MIEVKFYDIVEDELLKFAVIVAKHHGQWVFCQHKERDTYEWPGGHREDGEQIVETAKRELWEETGAVDYELKRVGIYSVIQKDNSCVKETFGMLYYADINRFSNLPNLEIEKIELFDDMPENWTYPVIQPKLSKKVLEVIA